MTAWFSPKRLGYGSGLPIAWQGWALILTYLVIVSGAIALAAHKPLALAGIVIPATVALVIGENDARGMALPLGRARVDQPIDNSCC
jgi:hypothetical protein